MGILKYIAYILGVIFIFFGVLFIWAAFGEVFNSGWLVTGIITVGIGFGLIIIGYFVGKRVQNKLVLMNRLRTKSISQVM